MHLCGYEIECAVVVAECWRPYAACGTDGCCEGGKLTGTVEDMTCLVSDGVIGMVLKTCMDGRKTNSGSYVIMPQ